MQRFEILSFTIVITNWIKTIKEKVCYWTFWSHYYKINETILECTIWLWLQCLSLWKSNIQYHRLCFDNQVLRLRPKFFSIIVCIFGNSLVHFVIFFFWSLKQQNLHFTKCWEIIWSVQKMDQYDTVKRILDKINALFVGYFISSGAADHIDFDIVVVCVFYRWDNFLF